MPSVPDVTEDETQSSLPPLICNNPREKVKPEQITTLELLETLFQKGKARTNITSDSLVTQTPQLTPLPEPFPRYPLAITWSPDKLVFEVNEEECVKKLWVWNCSTRTIYIHCCGLWNDMARLGASWRCWPRLRFRLVPGMMAEIYVKANPRELSPVPRACAGLQLAASHMRDNVVCYFVVPVQVIYLNYHPPNMIEG